MVTTGGIQFPEEEYLSRLQRVRSRMRVAGVDVLLVDTPENITYLTGFQTAGYYMYGCTVVPVEGDIQLVARRAELGNVKASAWVTSVTGYDDHQDPMEVVAGLAKQFAGPERTAVEFSSSFLTIDRVRRLAKTLGCSVETLVDGSALVLEERKIKSALEIAQIRQAARMASVAMREAVGFIAVGRTESEVAALIFDSLVREGCEFLAMEPYVNCGQRTGTVHASWKGQRIAAGDPVLVEIAGCANRYHGALMRTVFVGSVPEELCRWADVTNASLDAAIGAIRPGVTSGEVDEACRKVIEQAGLYDKFRKRTGYSIGLAYAPDWGEGHFLGLQKDDPSVLAKGMTFHIPPAIRQYDLYGYGASETVVVTESGCEVITEFPERLLYR